MIRWAVPAAAGAVLLGLAPSILAQHGLAPAEDPLEEEAEDDFLVAEGALQNDVFVPGNEDAEKELEAGDEALERSPERRDPASADAAAPSRELRLAFDAWHRALVAAPQAQGMEDSVRPRGASGSNRTRLSCTRAVLLRLAALDERLRAGWRRRFDEPARLAFAASGGRPEALARIASIYPTTPAAVRACLRLGDLALERGERIAAAGYYRRSSEQYELGLPTRENTLGAAIESRLESMATARGTVEANASIGTTVPGHWSRADELTSIGVLPFDGGGGRASSTSRRREYRGGVRPGAARLSDGRIALQTPERVFVVTSEGKELSQRSFSPGRLTDDHFGRPDPPSAPPIAPGWPLLPGAGPDGSLVLVDGRATVGSGEPNTLMCVDIPPDGETGLSLLTGEALPRLRWAVWGSLLVGPDGEAREIPELAPFEAAEFQPGPVVVGGTVVAQARLLGGDVEAWAFGFSLRSGELRWKRFLAKGSDIGRTERRLQRGPILAGQPLLAEGFAGAGSGSAERAGQVYIGTHLGALIALDAWDGGLLWSYQNRRRSAPKAGFSGPRPISAGPFLTWAPADSDRVYLLEKGPLTHLDAEPVAAVHPIGPASLLLEARRDGRLAQARAGRERTLSWLPAQGERHDAVYLSQDERFVGRGLASSERALLASDRGLYLFDRSRDLYLLDYLSVPEAGTGGRAAGDLFAFGPLLVVLGRQAAWFVATE